MNNVKINGLCMIIMSDLKKYGSMTGYDLTKIIPNTSHQQIYRELNKLTSLGYVKFEIEPQLDKPDKKNYSVVNSKAAKDFFNFALTQLPLNKSVPMNSLEGVRRAIDFAEPENIIRWCEQFIRIYTRSKNSADANNMDAEAYIRNSYIRYAKSIISKINRKVAADD